MGILWGVFADSQVADRGNGGTGKKIFEPVFWVNWTGNSVEDIDPDVVHRINVIALSKDWGVAPSVVEGWDAIDYYDALAYKNAVNDAMRAKANKSNAT